MLDRAQFDAAKHDVCFSLSTKDRTAHTVGSATPVGRRVPGQLAPNLACLREIHAGVVGGPDFAIFAVRARMVAPGYGHCGLIENDGRLGLGWFDAVMDLFARGRADGVDVGIGCGSTRSVAGGAGAGDVR